MPCSLLFWGGGFHVWWIGVDHGYIPIDMAKNGHLGSVVVYTDRHETIVERMHGLCCATLEDFFAADG